jgi:hypothetical protein
MNKKALIAGLLMVGLLILGGAGYMQATKLVQAQRKPVPTNPDAVTDLLPLRYLFSGVADDGQQGGSNRKAATSVHCTNLSLANNQVEVRVYQWNGTTVFTGTVNIPPNRTYTFSTQPTAIYFDDVTIGGFPGTTTIFQGSGRILAQSGDLICTVQVLDPLNMPPTFVTKLTLYYADGVIVGDDRYLYLPIILRP